MKNKKGFIQIPLLIAIIAGVLVLGGTSYIGVKWYKNYQTEKVEQQKVVQEREKEAEAQRTALQQAQREIEKLKEGSAEAQKKQEVLEYKVQSEQQKQNLSISAAEINPYLSGVVRIDCDDWWGSGSLWNRSDLGYSVLTNYHVVKDIGYADFKRCLIMPEEKAKDEYVDIALIKSSNKQLLDSKKDTAIIQLSSAQEMFPGGEQTKPLNKLNYSVGLLKTCAEKMPIGSPVMVIGFPAFAMKEISYQGYTTNQYFQISSNGIISGYDDSVNNPYWGELPYQNYFVSAKIDSGNSGGIAISKTTSGNLCLLGVPTWVSVGNYETQGLVQNINNIFSK